MFKFIAIIFLFLIFSIDQQVGKIIEPHYSTRQFVAVPATIVFNTVQKKNNQYQVVLYYDYAINGNNYRSQDIRDSQPYVFDNMHDAQDFAESYPLHKLFLAYYNPSHPSEAYIYSGLDIYDYTILILLIPLNLFGLLILSLAFIDKWKLNASNDKMKAISFFLFMGLLTSMGGNVFIGFNHMKINSNNQLVLVCLYFAIALVCGLFRKISGNQYKSKNKYQRLFNTRDSEMILDSPVKYTFNKVIKECSFSLFLLNCFSFMIILWCLAKNHFMLSNMIYAFIFIAVVANFIYLTNFIKHDRSANLATGTSMGN